MFQVTKLYDGMPWWAPAANLVHWPCRWLALRCGSCGDGFDLLFNLRGNPEILCPACGRRGPVKVEGQR